MKRWKRDLGLVRELGPDTAEFDQAVARVWARLEMLELAMEQLANETHGSETIPNVYEFARDALDRS